MLLDVIEQRVRDHNLVAHAGDHSFDVGQQVRVQLRVFQQVVVILLIDIAQDVVYQRFVIVGADGFRVDVLYLASGKMHAQPGFFGLRERFSGQFLQRVRHVMSHITHVLRDLFGAEIRQRITSAYATSGDRTVQADKALTHVGKAHAMAHQRLFQYRFQRGGHAIIKRFLADHRIQRPLLAELPQQVGKTGANRHLAAEQLHAVTRARLQR